MYNSYSTLPVTCVASYLGDDVAPELESRWLWVAAMERHLDLPASLDVLKYKIPPFFKEGDTKSYLEWEIKGKDDGRERPKKYKSPKKGSSPMRDRKEKTIILD
ncbi:hypothetical protein CR513_14146, partial [Mucuna pruriens]